MKTRWWSRDLHGRGSEERERRFCGTDISGSLPGFLAAFLGGKKLSAKEADELKKLIDSHREQEGGAE